MVIGPEQDAEYRRLREEEMRSIVRQRLAEVDAGAPVRVFTSAEEMIAASDAERTTRDA